MIWSLIFIFVFCVLAIGPTIHIKQPFLRRIAAAFFGVTATVAVGAGIGAAQTPASLLVIPVAMMHVFNAMRLVENRQRYERLRKVCLSTWIWTIVWTVGTSLILVFCLLTENTLSLVEAPIVFGAFFSVAILFVTTVRKVHDARPVAQSNYFSDDELPTLSVLIPARNEDQNLTDCIHSLLKSDYPKLEIIVLDDCSHDSSSDIIKRFAHKGVRFIAGDMPEEKWLAKNQAYSTLAGAASGDWLLFSGVDVRFRPQTLRGIVTHALSHQKDMIGLLPIRTRMHLPTAWLSPLRYWYELSVPFFVLRRPPVLSTCWLIEKKTYKDLGGFQAVTRSVVPEAYFARVLHDKNKYQFIRSGQSLQVQTEKSLAEQYQTAVRTRYPQVGKRIERQVAAMLLIIWLIGGTFFAVPYFMVQESSIVLVAILGSILLIASQTIITWYTSPKAFIPSLFVMPLLLIQEIGIFLISGYKYEFSKVTWKDRNICYPVMHISRRLPELDD